MVSSDYETRIGAHRVFSVVLVPSSVCPRSSPNNRYARKAANIQRTLSRTVSVFSSSAALFQKLGKEQSSLPENSERKDNMEDGEDARNNPSILKRLTSSYSRAYSMKKPSLPVITEDKNTNTLDKESVCIKLSTN